MSASRNRVRPEPGFTFRAAPIVRHIARPLDLHFKVKANENHVHSGADGQEGGFGLGAYSVRIPTRTNSPTGKMRSTMAAATRRPISFTFTALIRAETERPRSTCPPAFSRPTR